MPHRLHYRGPRRTTSDEAPPVVNQIPDTILANRLSTVSILLIVGGAVLVVTGGVWIGRLGAAGAALLTCWIWPVSVLCSAVALALAIRDTNRRRDSGSGPRAIWYAIGSFAVIGAVILILWLAARSRA